MNTNTNNRWMVWAIVILAVMNITTILTLAYHHHQAIKEENTAYDPGQVSSESASMKFSGRYFRDELNLTREQMNMFSEFNPLFRRQVQTINLRLNSIRQQMLSEMSEAPCDTARLNMLSDSVGYLHASLKKLTYRYYMDFKRICDKQQQVKLEQLFGQMFATDIQTGQHGMEGPHGRGRGRRFNN